MDILFVAKCDYSGLTEGICRGFAGLGHRTAIFDLGAHRRIRKYVFPGITRRLLEAKLARFRPDLVFVIAPFFVRPDIQQAIEEFRTSRKCLTVGWVGDILDPALDDPGRLATYDRIYYTDTGMEPMFRNRSAAYLPLATDPGLFRTLRARKDAACVLVASWTPNRGEFLAAAGRPVSLYGPGWRKRRKQIPRHKVCSGAVSLVRTGRIYTGAKTALNLRNARNVINGLNQRSFDPCACRTLLLHDAVPDLSLNFDVGKELLVFSSPEEFDAVYDRAMSDEPMRVRVAEQGYRRVMAEHTFTHRAIRIAHDLDV